MYQIDNSTVAPVIPASTALGVTGFFTDGNPALGVAATILPAEFMNMLMLEVLNVLNLAGVAPVKSKFDQLALAITQIVQGGNTQYGVDTGVANACVVPYSPVVTSFVDGQLLRFRAKTANTGPCTFAPNMLIAKPLIGLAGALQGGEIAAGSYCLVVWSVPLGSWLLLAASGANLQVPTATKSLHAINFAQAQSLIAGSRGALCVSVDTAIVPGTYLVDTRAGPLTLTLPAAPVTGASNFTFIDPANKWGINNWVLARNGKTIAGKAEDLTVNVSDQQFSIWYDGSDWKLF